MIVNAIISLGSNFYTPFIFVYAQQTLQFNPMQIGIINIASGVFSLAIGVPLATSTDLFGRKPVMITALVGTSITIIGISLFNGNDFWAVFAVMGLSWAFGWSQGIILGTWMDDHCPKEAKGSALAYSSLASSLTGIIGVTVGGVVADTFASAVGVYSPLIFLIGGIILLFALPIIIRVKETIKKPVPGQTLTETPENNPDIGSVN